MESLRFFWGGSGFKKKHHLIWGDTLNLAHPGSQWHPRSLTASGNPLKLMGLEDETILSFLLGQTVTFQGRTGKLLLGGSSQLVTPIYKPFISFGWEKQPQLGDLLTFGFFGRGIPRSPKHSHHPERLHPGVVGG